MFAGVINQAKSAVSGLVLKYVARASVAVPFVIALGFVIAAISVMLVQRFGHATAYWMMAGGLVAIGVIAAIAVSVKEHEEEVAEQKAEASDTREVVNDATSQALTQAPIALLGTLVTAPGGITHTGRGHPRAELSIGAPLGADRRAVLAQWSPRPGFGRRRSEVPNA